MPSSCCSAYNYHTHRDSHLLPHRLLRYHLPPALVLPVPLVVHTWDWFGLVWDSGLDFCRCTHIHCHFPVPAFIMVFLYMPLVHLYYAFPAWFILTFHLTHTPWFALHAVPRSAPAGFIPCLANPRPYPLTPTPTYPIHMAALPPPS